MTTPRTSVTRLSAANRSRASNRVDAVAGADKRTAAARRFRDVAGALISDQGGETKCSEARLQIIRRLAGVSVLAEQVEVKIVGGEAVAVDDYCALASTAVRLIQRLGIDRKSKNVVPTLREYIAGHATVDVDAEVTA